MAGEGMTRRGLSVAIIGGGIGGLSAALSLLRTGCDVHVFEQAQTLTAVGAGIQISPNASRILRRLIPPAKLEEHAVRPIAVHQQRWDDGRTLQRIPLAPADEAIFGAPYYTFHRADLVTALASAISPGCLRLGHRFVAFAHHDDCIEVSFDNGGRIKVDMVVGADGIHSAVRGALFGLQEARFTGCIAYRGVVPAERLVHLKLEMTSNIWLGPGKHFVHYFVAGGHLVNFVAVEERDTWRRESWTDRGNVADLASAFAGWHSQVREIIAGAEETFIWALFDRAPLAHWSAGPVTLLGDACHAMLPFMGQGAAQAIEDGATLAACVADMGDRSVPDVLRRYELLRSPRTTRLQQMSYANKTLFHLADGAPQQQRDLEMARWDGQVGSFDWLFGHDAEIVAA
jgi:salicylate hydroxylase